MEMPFGGKGAKALKTKVNRALQANYAQTKTCATSDAMAQFFGAGARRDTVCFGAAVRWGECTREPVGLVQI